MKKVLKLSLMLGGCFIALASCGGNNNKTTSQATSTTPGSTIAPTTVAPSETQPTVKPTTVAPSETQPTVKPTTVAPSETQTTVKPTTLLPTVTTTTTTTTTVGPVVLNNTEVYVVGDSTVSSFTDSYYYPRYGYGTQLENYFDDKATVINYALSGRSSKSFIEEANYDLLKSGLSEGDYLIVGFGHNDEKSDEEARFTDASKPITDNNSFKYYLNTYYVELAKSVGATPILCTPIVRASKTDDYTGSTAHITATGDYRKAIVELGEEVDCTVIDLTTITKTKYTEIGYQQAQYYHAMTAGKYAADGETVIPDTNSVDTTHLNIYGAKFVAYSFANAIKETDNTLGNYVLADIQEPTRANDLVANPSYVVPSYQSPDLANYVQPDHFKTITEGWYGTAFGDCGGTPSTASNGYVAQETTAGVFSVGQSADSNKGKFASAGDGIAYLFRQVDVKYNFTVTAEAKVIKQAGVKQAGFGLMLRDDAYINQSTSKVMITTNYVAAGFVTTDTNMNVLFYRENSTLTKHSNVVSSLYAVDDTATLTITRVGQTVTTTVVYKNETYTTKYVDFDFQAMDNSYMYVGMFATRGTVVEFTNVVFTITGESQGA